MPVDALADDTPSDVARAMRIADLPSDKLTVFFPEHDRFFVSPDVLTTLDLEYGNNKILSHIIDDGARDELEDTCPNGFGVESRLGVREGERAACDAACKEF